MNSQMQRVLQDPRITLNRSGAIAVWLIGAYMTSSFLFELGMATPANYLMGIVVQVLLTKAQSPLWRPTNPPIPLRTRLYMFKGAAIAVMIDTVLNMSGVWPYLNNLGSSTVWAMLNEITSSTEAPAVAVRALFAMLLGLLTAGGAEVLWEQED